MRARVWKQGNLWHYLVYRRTVIGGMSVRGERPTWRQAYDAAVREIQWQASL